MDRDNKEEVKKLNFKLIYDDYIASNAVSKKDYHEHYLANFLKPHVPSWYTKPCFETMLRYFRMVKVAEKVLHDYHIDPSSYEYGSNDIHQKVYFSEPVDVLEYLLPPVYRAKFKEELKLADDVSVDDSSPCSDAIIEQYDPVSSFDLPSSSIITVRKGANRFDFISSNPEKSVAKLLVLLDKLS